MTINPMGMLAEERSRTGLAHPGLPLQGIDDLNDRAIRVRPPQTAGNDKIGMCTFFCIGHLS